MPNDHPSAVHAPRSRRARGRDPRVPPRHDSFAHAWSLRTVAAGRSARSRPSGVASRPACCASTRAPKTFPHASRSPGCGSRRWATTACSRPSSQRKTRAFVAGRAGYPIDDDVPGRPEVLLAEGDCSSALKGPRVAVVGTRAATPHGLADAHEIGVALGEARCHRRERARDRHRRRGAPGRARRWRWRDRRRRHRARHRVPAAARGLVQRGSPIRPARQRTRVRRAATPGRVSRPEPDHRRARRRRCRRGGDVARRRPHHGRARAGVRAAGAGDAGVASQPCGRGYQRPDRRRRTSVARAVRRVARDRAHPGVATHAAAAAGAAGAMRRACSPRVVASPPRSTNSRAVPRSGPIRLRSRFACSNAQVDLERAQGLCWPKG